MRTKIEVVRSALDLLERDAERTERVAKWRKAVGVAAPESRAALRDFRLHSRLRQPILRNVKRAPLACMAI